VGIEYRNDRERKFTLVRWTGPISSEEFLEHVQALCDDPDWPPAPGGRHLCDLRLATLDGSIDEDLLAKAASLYGQQAGIDSLRVAIVADQAFWKAVKFDELFSREGGKSVVFNSLPTACAWLGLDPAETEKELAR
jgi:hypothetical protein